MITKNKNIVSVIAHVAAWVCFFTLPYLVFFPRMLDSQYTMSDHMFASIVCNNFFLVVFYYLNTQILIPKLLMQEKWFLYITAVISSLVLFLIIPKYIAGIVAPPEIRTFQRPSLPNTTGRNWQGRKRPLVEPFNMAIFFMVFTVGTCVAVIQRWLKTEEHRKETESEKLNTELSFLKSQINPHFFFNTLNNIYSLAIVKSEKTAPAVMKLSSIMRYILTETNNDFVPLQNEVDFTKNYIELQQVRLTEKTTVNFDVIGNVENKNIAPLLFIPFVENAFKYGISTKSISEINIHIESLDNKIIFTSSNSIVKSENNMMENTGIGINNVKRRLELMYSDKHVLTNTIKDNIYQVHLEISI
ncbi:MAG: sensor histidine kinase [Bacteroidetes bacterium]|nr:sensor histidine kinase [Bacteroidota bacterium]